MIPTQRPPSLITGHARQVVRAQHLQHRLDRVRRVHRGHVGLHDVAHGQRHGAQLTGYRASCRAMTDFWAGRRVLVTGHTGFKGGWLALWLHGSARR